ncbi:MAG: type II secretion system protein [Alphaproteobacteria bacterium]|nr:type II secretion system protein [Alphaproteobacteria bacterium]MBO5441818.1 type II secretion system protein [Alphaproteobacteria bacterium]
MMRTNESGRSMIEMLGVLAIVGVLSVGGIAGYSKAMAKFKTNKLIDQVNMLSTNIRTMYSSQRTYKGLVNGLAAKVGIAPAEMYDAQNLAGVAASSANFALSNAFGGKVVIKAAKTNTDEDSYVIAFDEIPAASCVTIATTDWGNDSGSGLQAISITGGDATVAAGTLTAGTETASTAAAAPSATGGTIGVVGVTNSLLPMTLPTATVACGTVGEVSIAWKYL